MRVPSRSAAALVAPLGLAREPQSAGARQRAAPGGARMCQPSAARVRCLWLAAWLTSCAGSSSTAPATAQAEAAAVACQQTLEPRAVPRPPAPLAQPVVAPASRVIVEAQLPLARLTAELEPAVPARIAEAAGLRLGPAGVLRYSVDRGPFSISVVDSQLVIETPLQGRAEACSGRRCYAACEPQARARALIPLWLRPDYRFERSRVALELTRGCKVRALGGLFSLDVTPMLRAALARQIERIATEIDRRLPDLRRDVERGWRQLSAPRALPLVGCLVLDPLGLVQGPLAESGGTLHARFALLARPELRSECSASPASTPLPPLVADPALPAEDGVTLGMEVPLARLARAFEAAAPGAAGGAALRVARAQVEARGNAVAAELTLAGELCGSLALQAVPEFSGAEGVLALGAGQLDSGEGERVRTAGGDPAALAQRLTQLPRLTPPLSLPLLRSAAPAVASLFSHPELALRAQLSSLRAAGAAVRGEQLVAWVEARGRLLLQPK